MSYNNTNARHSTRDSLSLSFSPSIYSTFPKNTDMQDMSNPAQAPTRSNIPHYLQYNLTPAPLFSNPPRIPSPAPRSPTSTRNSRNARRAHWLRSSSPLHPSPLFVSSRSKPILDSRTLSRTAARDVRRERRIRSPPPFEAAAQFFSRSEVTGEFTNPFLTGRERLIAGGAIAPRRLGADEGDGDVSPCTVAAGDRPLVVRAPVPVRLVRVGSVSTLFSSASSVFYDCSEGYEGGDEGEQDEIVGGVKADSRWELFPDYDGEGYDNQGLSSSVLKGAEEGGIQVDPSWEIFPDYDGNGYDIHDASVFVLQGAGMVLREEWAEGEIAETVREWSGKYNGGRLAKSWLQRARRRRFPLNFWNWNRYDDNTDANHHEKRSMAVVDDAADLSNSGTDDGDNIFNVFIDMDVDALVADQSEIGCELEDHDDLKSSPFFSFSPHPFNKNCGCFHCMRGNRISAQMAPHFPQFCPCVACTLLKRRQQLAVERAKTMAETLKWKKMYERATAIRVKAEKVITTHWPMADLMALRKELWDEMDLEDDEEDRKNEEMEVQGSTWQKGVSCRGPLLTPSCSPSPSLFVIGESLDEEDEMDITDASIPLSPRSRLRRVIAQALDKL